MSNPLRVLLVDDEGLARRGLKVRLQAMPEVEIVGECANGREALAAVAGLAPDLVFLDIQMPGLDGFDVVRGLPAGKMPMIVFVTAFDHYAVQAFDVNAVDYVLKPIDGERLRLAVERACQRRTAGVDKQRLLELIERLTSERSGSVPQWLGEGVAGYPEKIAIKEGGEMTLLPSRQIDWIDAAGDYMCLHADGIVHIMRITMNGLLAQLDPAVFQRIHRSTIVNMLRVKKICSQANGEHYVVLDGGQRLKMSRRYKDKVQLFF